MPVRDDARNGINNALRRSIWLRALAVAFGLAVAAFGGPSHPFLSPTNIFAPASTPAQSIFDLSRFVLEVTGAIFMLFSVLLVYAVVKFRKTRIDRGARASASLRKLSTGTGVDGHSGSDCRGFVPGRGARYRQHPERVRPSNALEVTVIGHQFWWEYRYPSLKVVTANELHIPVSDPAHPTPTFLTLLSADTDHSFWVPRLAGKTDLIPNHPNSMWVDPHETGLYLGQCAQYCGTQHALMLLRVYVDSREDFDRWIHQQSQPARISSTVSEGQRIFETTACVNCHTVAGTRGEWHLRSGSHASHEPANHRLRRGEEHDRKPHRLDLQPGCDQTRKQNAVHGFERSSNRPR